MNKAARNIWYDYLLAQKLSLLKCLILGYMAGAYLTFNETTSGCTSKYAILYSYPQFMRLPFVSHPHQYLIYSIFKMLDMLIGIYYYLIIILICVSLVINDVESLLKYLLFYTPIFGWSVCSEHLPISLSNCLCSYDFWDFFIYSEFKSFPNMWFSIHFY